jgi:hypothetical protein
MRVRKDLAGPSTKEGKGLKKGLGRRKVAMLKLLDQLYLWMVIGTDRRVEEHKMTPEAVKAMLKTGEGPWEAGTGAAIYWGKLAHRCRSDLARCEEELLVLCVEKRRLGQWAVRTLEAVERRIEVVGAGSGKGFLLGRWKKMILELELQLERLKW